MKDLEQFRAWLAQQGADVLPCKSQWEVARWKIDDITYVMYVNGKGKHSWSGAGAEAKWALFLAEAGALPAAAEALPAPTKAFTCLPPYQAGTYRGADLHTADDRWIATIHHTGLHDKPNDDFAAICRLLEKAPEMFVLLRELKGLKGMPPEGRVALDKILNYIEPGEDA